MAKANTTKQQTGKANTDKQGATKSAEFEFKAIDQVPVSIKKDATAVEVNGTKINLIGEDGKRLKTNRKEFPKTKQGAVALIDAMILNLMARREKVLTKKDTTTKAIDRFKKLQEKMAEMRKKLQAKGIAVEE